jgi:hypothetical protein
MTHQFSQTESQAFAAGGPLQCDTVHYCTQRVYNAAVPRKLKWIERQNFQGFGCSECNWKFSPSGALTGDSLDEMKKRYEGERDCEFAAHVCAKHPISSRPKIA